MRLDIKLTSNLADVSGPPASGDPTEADAYPNTGACVCGDKLLHARTPMTIPQSVLFGWPWSQYYVIWLRRLSVRHGVPKKHAMI
jgi:hypothetical protein